MGGSLRLWMITDLARSLSTSLEDSTNAESSPQGSTLELVISRSGPTTSCPPDSSDMSSSPLPVASWTTKRQEGSTLEAKFWDSSSKNFAALAIVSHKPNFCFARPAETEFCFRKKKKKKKKKNSPTLIPSLTLSLSLSLSLS